MIYRFNWDPGLRDHDLEANISITRGVPQTWMEPGDGPQLELAEVHLVRGERRRRLCPKLEARVEDHLVGKTFEILEDLKD